MIKVIPNLVTLGGLFCGFYGLVNLNQGNLFWAAWAIIAAAFLDLFDGLLARALKVQSAIGAQLDSLCDLVNFGVLPSLIALELFHRFAHDEFWFAHYKVGNSWSPGNAYVISLLLFVYLLGAVLRLARFNVIKEKGFKGLPSPAAGIFMAGFPLVYLQNFEKLPIDADLATQLYANGLVLFVATISLGILMVLPIPLMSFKGLKGNFKSLFFPILLLVVSIILVVSLGYLAIQLVIIFYLIVSLLQKIFFNEVSS